MATPSARVHATPPPIRAVHQKTVLWNRQCAALPSGRRAAMVATDFRIRVPSGTSAQVGAVTVEAAGG
jgi:hypothetical protein